MNTNTLYKISRRAEVLDLSTSEWIPVTEMAGTSFLEYNHDPYLIIPEFFMVENEKNETVIVEDVGPFEAIEVYWTGINGRVYGVSAKFLI